ncbi:PIN domain-containing protein [Sporomusa malonica]|uniref:PIN domain-containing protein n=1 Tax=Sporomusa malonica TaxID=112901 RepID=A0A1W2EJ88_9FIRM|nr:PIN domain-containing protein [Sporomusa malonica]SMD09763.1 PIN domain-containing protein [Sporomusa malonica]
MQSVIQHINTEVLNLKKLLNDLMECSDIVRWNYSKIIMSGGDYHWEELNDNGRKIQDQLLNNYNRFTTLIRFLTNDLSSAQQRAMETSAQKVFNLIEQNGFLFRMNKEEQINSAMKAIDQQFNLIATSYEVTDDYCLIIPDSSTLIANSEIDKWKFEEIDRFKIMLLPTVVDELEKAITNNDPVRNKHKNKILEYTKLGNIIDGVKINEHNIIKLVDELQKTEKTLSWLDINNNYDVVIASYFEIVKANPHSQVILITNNPSLREKALSSNVTHIKPPLLPVEIKPVKSTSVDIKPVVEPVNTAPAAIKPKEKVMPPDSKSENKPTKVTVPPNMLNRPPAIGPIVPKVKSKPITDIKLPTTKQKDARSKASKPKR